MTTDPNTKHKWLEAVITTSTEGPAHLENDVL